MRVDIPKQTTGNHRINATLVPMGLKLKWAQSITKKKKTSKRIVYGFIHILLGMPPWGSHIREQMICKQSEALFHDLGRFTSPLTWVIDGICFSALCSMKHQCPIRYSPLTCKKSSMIEWVWEKLHTVVPFGVYTGPIIYYSTASRHFLHHCTYRKWWYSSSMAHWSKQARITFTYITFFFIVYACD